MCGVSASRGCSEPCCTEKLLPGAASGALGLSWDLRAVPAPSHRPQQALEQSPSCYQCELVPGAPRAAGGQD